MRQVPSYIIIGNGRLARHLQHYFSLLGLTPRVWHRSQPFENLSVLLEQATHVLVLTSDNQIENFIKKHLLAANVLRIHCSGSLYTPLAYGAHPLFTFNSELYDLATYERIPFIIDDDAPDFAELFPGLNNRWVRLDKNLKAKYHAYCVLSANFSCLLWQKLFSAFEQELNIPAQLARPLLLQQTKNLSLAPQTALTGPLIRGDKETIAKNLAALEGDPFQQVYQSFVDCYAFLNSQETQNE